MTLTFSYWQDDLTLPKQTLHVKFTLITFSPHPDLVHAGAAEPGQLPQPRRQQRSPRPALNSLPDLVNHYCWTFDHLEI